MVPLRLFGLWLALAVAPALAQFPLSIDTTRTLDAGLDHNVAVITSGANAGQVWTWGGNENGKLGNGTTFHSSLPVRAGKGIAGFTSIVAVAAAHANSFAIGSDGTLWAWGDHANGVSGSRLGLGSAPSLESCRYQSSTTPCARSPRKVPVPGTPGAGAGGTQKVVQAGGGWGHAVALRDDGTVWQWGSTFLPTQVGGLTDVTQIAVGYFHTVALRSNGALVAWGQGSQGQLGNGLASFSSTPVAVSVLTGVVSIRAKGAFTLALKSDATLWAWGSDAYGQIGNDATLASVGLPVQVMTGVSFMAAGFSTAFARKTDGSVWGWGLNQLQQLGTTPPHTFCASRDCEPIPKQLPTSYNNAIGLVAGGAHSIVVGTDQSLAIFGVNSAGQLAVDDISTASFSQSHFDPAGTMTPLPVGGSGSSVGARSRVSGLSLLALGAGIDFGSQAVGTSSRQELINFENLDTAGIGIVTISVPTGFTKSADNCSGTTVAASGGSCTFTVAFTPPSAGDLTNPLTINTDAAENPAVDVVLAGVGIGVPGAPSSVFASAGDAQAVVSFSPPSSNGGGAIGFYTATSSPGGASASGAGSPITVGGLANGGTYTFTVTATNAAGTGAASDPSNAVTPQAAAATLTVSKSGAGSGIVTSSPSGINCGATCAAPFGFGSAVALSAAASAGSTFAGWSGACNGTGACDVTMDASKGVTATFAVQAMTLTVSKSGAGSGIVTSSPSGIDCGATCNASFGFGSTVALSAAASAGSTFAGWSGACGGAGACNVTMDAARSVTATFIVSARPGTDINADGRSDVLYWNSATGQVYRFFANGFALTSGALIYTEPNTAWKIVSDADFTGDGVTDLLWRNSSTGQVYLMSFNAGGFPHGGGVIYVEPNAAWKIVATPDIDGDGKADLVWWNSSTGQVYIILVNGFALGSQGLVYTEPNTAWRIEAAGDFAGSGRKNQLMWRNGVTGQVYLMTVNASGGAFVVGGQIVYHSTPPYQIVAAADFNGDGKSDLLWRRGDTGHVYMMLFNGPAISVEGQIYHEPNLAWKIVSVGDYDGDGKADLLWRNDASGHVYMMLMNGMAIAAQALVYLEPNTDWKLLGPGHYAQ